MNYVQLSSTRVRVGASPVAKEQTCYTEDEMGQKRAQITLYGIGAVVAGSVIGYWFHKLYGKPKRTK
jgi:hypothetical protein